MTKTIAARLQAAAFALVFGLSLMTAATATPSLPATAAAAFTL